MMDIKEALQVIEENLAVDYGNLDHEQTKRLDEAIDMAIGALKAQADGDTISRKAAIHAMEGVDWYHINKDGQLVHGANSKEDEPLYKAKDVYKVLNDLPSAQTEPLSDAYMKAVWTWLLNYQIKAAELQGRYTPYEVLSWVANDWRKEHEWFD